MISIENTDYEESIERLIKKYGNKTLSNAIRKLISTLYHDARSVSKIFINPELIRGKISKFQNTLRLKPADLKSIVADEIVYLVDNGEQRSRVEVVYKYLCNFYSGNRILGMGEIENGIEAIRNGQKFPTHDDSNKKEGKDDGKYKALGNLFLNETGESNEHTLKFGLAILGIKPSYLSDYLAKPDNSNSDEVRKDAFNSKKETVLDSEPSDTRFSPNRYLLPVLGIAAIFIMALQYFDQKTPEKIPSNMEIQSETLFINRFTFPPEGSMVDSLVLELIPIDNEQALLGQEKVGIDSLLIRIRLTNLSDRIYFPDMISLVVLDAKELKQKVVKRNVSTMSQVPSLTFDMPQSLIFNIVSSGEDSAMPPFSHQDILALVTSTRKRTGEVFEFKVKMQLHNGKVEKQIITDKSFKILFQ